MDEIIKLILPLYKIAEVDKIEKALTNYIKELPKVEPEPYNTDWYKDSAIYMLYPESIQTTHEFPLESIIRYLQQIKNLNCNAIHLLPFLESPMIDKGFDISNYYKVRSGLGGMEALMRLKKEADRLGIHIFMDLVFNHVSKNHEWFIKAENGDDYYRNFFLYTKDPPQYLGKVYRSSSVYAQYLVNGEKTLVNVAFPEFAGEVPHWVQGKDKYWYYHTYYPDQLDLNWKNAEVFIELSKVLLFWANKGFNFRLDAIPFIGKSAYKHLNTHNVFTHHLTTIFNLLAKQVHPNPIFILEVNEHFEPQTEYFGNANQPQAHLLYDFQLTTSLWVSLIENNIRHLWRKLQKGQKIPVHAQWINFLRNHDELSFAYLDNALIKEVHEKLLPLGKTFREGFGIAGRTYSLLKSDQKRFLMAYFLLSSLPGSMLIPYGDEYGMSNIPESQLSPTEQSDSRNINRGTISKEFMQSTKAQQIFPHIKQIIETRLILRNYLNVKPEEIIGINDKSLFAAKYKLGTSELLILINISQYPKTIQLTTEMFQQVAHINQVNITEHKIDLGAYGGTWLQK